MSFRLVPKSVTLNDLERRNGRYFALFQRIRVAIPGALRKSSRSLSYLLMSSCQHSSQNVLYDQACVTRCVVCFIPRHLPYSVRQQLNSNADFAP